MLVAGDVITVPVLGHLWQVTRVTYNETEHEMTVYVVGITPNTHGYGRARVYNMACHQPVKSYDETVLPPDTIVYVS